MPPDIDSNRLEDIFGRELHTRDIVVIAARGNGVAPCFTAQAAQWLFVRGAKLVALADGISIGRESEPDDERVILSTLLENDVPVVRGLINTETLSAERMAFMALPRARRRRHRLARPLCGARSRPRPPPRKPWLLSPEADQEVEAVPPPAADPADLPDEPADSAPESPEPKASTEQGVGRLHRLNRIRATNPRPTNPRLRTIGMTRISASEAPRPDLGLQASAATDLETATRRRCG